MEVLGREKFFIFQLEEFKSEPRKILKDLFDFLELGESLKLRSMNTYEKITYRPTDFMTVGIT